jgi:hypothetical protein
MVLEGPLRWPFALQAMHRVAIETPSIIVLTFLLGGYLQSMVCLSQESLMCPLRIE